MLLKKLRKGDSEIEKQNKSASEEDYVKENLGQWKYKVVNLVVISLEREREESKWMNMMR